MRGRPLPLLAALTALLTTILSATAAGATSTTAGSAATRASVSGPAPASTTASATATPTRHTITYDHYSLLIDGKRQYIWSGEFHYFRLPSPELWRDMLQKIKASGFNTVSLYFSWAYNSPAPGRYDFTGVRDVDRLLRMAEQAGLYVIARPGPYINGELDAGGYPGWLLTQKGRARSAAADYTAAYREWLAHIDPIIARHQLTNGTGSVILYQVENEYDGSDAAYMTQLAEQARADGITVPIFHNDKKRQGKWASGAGAPDLYASDTYPGTSVTDYSFMRSFTGPNRPLFWAEFQGGWFQPWGGGSYEENRTKFGPSFERITYGNNIDNHFTLQNLYMLYGGTNWGWQADPNVVYTSYDYGAAFDESRRLTAKIPVLKQQGYFVQSVEPLRKTDDLPGQPEHSGAAVHVDADRNPDDGTTFYFLRHEDIKQTTDEATTLRVETSDGTYTVPQQPGTAIHVNGPDYKILTAGYTMDHQRLVYSTSEIMTHEDLGDRDVALLHGRKGEAGETVLRYASQPRVDVLAGDVQATWSGSDLRLNYTHDGLARVRISGGGRAPLDLLLADDDTASTFWRPGGKVLVRGPYLVKTAELDGATLRLTGETEQAGPLEVFAGPGVRTVLWNGRPVRASRTASGSLLATVPGPRAVSLPALDSWRFHEDTLEAAPGFDDSGWAAADHQATDNPTQPKTLPVLYADDYGFHHGDVWYRGHFDGTAAGISLTAGTGKAGVWSAWLNGTLLSTVSTGTGGQNSSRDFTFPPEALGAHNVVSVLVRNMGHNEDGGSNDAQKNPRGLLSAALTGSGAAVAWRIQGGGNDEVRGPLNNGGLHGERAGWTLPSFADRTWPRATSPSGAHGPGIAWYRTRVRLSLPKGQDTPLVLRFTGGQAARALIFVNGWNLGQYVADLGPQHDFVLPPGVLRTNGVNTIALGVWSYDGSGGLGTVTLERADGGR
ncbi:beta-galactosidase [Actinoallomurus sp. NPDC050550]|uniref:glycoside hydrolase family 35 protein n=1 Tax=Actinoallomurus sp. NPDC050550 TaxID=3154937 RepID=UPI0033C354C2